MVKKIKHSSILIINMPNIKFVKVEKNYQDNKFNALQNINLLIKQGEFVSIVGKSGAGKTTLTKLIYAEEMPTEGDVFYGKRNIKDIKKKHLPYFRRNFGTVFQDFKLLPQKTVFENVAYALEVIGSSTDAILEEVPKILSMVDLLEESDKYPNQLSGGEKQKVALARALINRPDVIIADEPTGNLDYISSLEIIKLLLKINELGATIILATHDEAIVNKAGKRVITIEDGKIVGDQVKGKYVI